MLKWKFQSGDLDMESRIALQRAGLEIQRQHLGRDTMVKENKALKETVEFHKRFIETLIKDKEKSLQVLENVMDEFSRLDKQITMAEEEAAREKQISERLQSDVEHWKTECKNLQVCSYILQADLYSTGPNNRWRNQRVLVREHGDNRPMAEDVLASVHQNPTQRRSSQDENFQNIENESRLEGHTSVSTASHVCTRQTCGRNNILSAKVQKTNSPAIAILQESCETLQHDSFRRGNNCFKSLLRKIRRGSNSR